MLKQYGFRLLGMFLLAPLCGGCVAPDQVPGGQFVGRVPAVIVIANETLFSPGYQDAPAMVVFSQESSVDVAQLKALAKQVVAVRGLRPADPDASALARAVSDETYRGNWFEQYPPALAGNGRTWLAHVMIRRAALPEGLLRGRPLLFDLFVEGERPYKLVLVGEATGDDR